jgi:squalene-associated FAD-dependent desaturase
VIGSGLAGLSCALELAEHGVAVTVLESQQASGGKAASWRDEDGHIVDSGQHVVTPLYQHLLALLKKIGAEDKLIWKDGHYYIATRGGKIDSIRIASLPAPFHFLYGLARYGNLSWRDRLSGMRAFAEILLSSDRHRRKFDDVTFFDWMRSRGASKVLLQHLMEPMIEGLMFLNSEEVSATNAIFDLHYMLRDRHSARFGFFDGGLSECVIEPLVALLKSRGVQVQHTSPVARIEFVDSQVERITMADGAAHTADAYVSAVPVHTLCGLLPEAAWRHQYFSDLRLLKPVPVIGVQVWFDRKVMLIDDLILTPDCVFNAYVDASNILTEYRASCGSVIHLVVAPAAQLLSMCDKELVALVLTDFRDVFPSALHAIVLKAVVVRTPESFPAQRPGMEKYRPAQRTPLPNFYLAGEYTRNRYPPCMEGAVMSGILAAGAVRGAES